jgi:hypothetical protein
LGQLTDGKQKVVIVHGRQSASSTNWRSKYFAPPPPRSPQPDSPADRRVAAQQP